MEATAERFRALARSSPWRWSSLTFVLTRHPERSQHDAAVRARLRRPGLLRVETLSGELLQVVRDENPRTIRLMTRSRWTRGATRQLASPASRTPTVDPDGLVRRRPTGREVDYDDPMYQDYAWVAMLDPVELADGNDDAPGTSIERLQAVEHHGRTAWEATLRPTEAYTPRCTCCALLLSEQSEQLEADHGGLTLRSREPDLVFADAHLVRLDVQTGVCVYTEQLGGHRDGWTRDVRIEAVDEPMPDEVFAEPRRRRWSRPRR